MFICFWKLSNSVSSPVLLLSCAWRSLFENLSIPFGYFFFLVCETPSLPFLHKRKQTQNILLLTVLYDCCIWKMNNTNHNHSNNYSSTSSSSSRPSSSNKKFRKSELARLNNSDTPIHENGAGRGHTGHLKGKNGADDDVDLILRVQDSTQSVVTREMCYYCFDVLYTHLYNKSHPNRPSFSNNS